MISNSVLIVLSCDYPYKQTHIMKTSVVIAIMLTTDLLVAQIFFTEIPVFPPFEGVRAGAVSISDVDNDNDNDVLITGLDIDWDRITRLYINDGQNIFSIRPGNSFVGLYTSSITFADVDDDQDNDVLITGRDEFDINHATLYLNDGQGKFTEQPDAPFDSVNLGAVAFADIDSDNDQDVVVTGQNNSNSAIAKLYLNDGQGIFTQDTINTFEGLYRSSIAFSDVDNDDDDDLLMTGFDQLDEPIAKLFLNDQGVFTDQVGTPFTGVSSSSIAFSDVDGDNDDDVLITGRAGPNLHIAKLYLNDGQGVFTEQENASFDGVAFGSIAFLDAEGDDDQDVLITGRDGSNGKTAALYLNDGQGNFTLEPGTIFEDVETSAIAVGDMDGDNDLDVFITGSSPTINETGPIAKLYRNRSMTVPATEVKPSRLQFSISPNPATSHMVNINIQSSTSRTISIRVCSVSGKSLIDYEVHPGAQNIAVPVDLTSLSDGIYLIEVDDEVNRLVKKLVIQ